VRGVCIADKPRTPCALTAADLNGDRHPDIVPGYTEGPHAVFINDGSGKRFVEVTFGDKAGAAYGFAIGDINGDGKPDIVLARSGAPSVLDAISDSATPMCIVTDARRRM
jgi:FG-GAP-like repeat